MAIATLEFDWISGHPLDIRLSTPGANNVPVFYDEATERSNDPGSYAIDIADIPSNLYRLAIVYRSSGIVVVRGILQHTNEAGVERPAMDDQGAPGSNPNISIETTVIEVN